ncbi:MAG: hypothetical protein IMZ47_02560 [Firmicutes bacterium]|nr:hypothetical protein [Bacillota bacterium]
MIPSTIYLDSAARATERALSLIDIELTSPSIGSFDRTWWCWKFSDFSAPRLQEGIFTLAWLYSSPLADQRFRGKSVLLERADAAIRFWVGLQHADGSFDEAYPFERSFAATAFTSFYIGHSIERLMDFLSADTLKVALRAIEQSAKWLAANGEYHGILSNHLAAAAGALQIAGDLLGTDRFLTDRDRYLGIIYREQDDVEGWMREYDGADPGYQSHCMFYLAAILNRTQDSELRERLTLATEFIAWFIHPDGTLGGEYASRGTKFAFPAAFEILASKIPMAAAVAAHLRECIVHRRGVGADQMDQWNLFPLLNNLLFASEVAENLSSPTQLPWCELGAEKTFPNAGLYVANRNNRLLTVGLTHGGVIKLWDINTKELIYEDCGYALKAHGKPLVSQSYSAWRRSNKDDSSTFIVESGFKGIASLRFNPWLFVCFRLFTLTVGVLPSVARMLKNILVTFLIKRKKPSVAKLTRQIEVANNGTLLIKDQITGISEMPIPLARQVSVHMGSSRYADVIDFLGARDQPGQPKYNPTSCIAERIQIIK